MSLQAHHENRPTRPRQIDNLEAKAQDVLRSLPSFRNLLRPINRLPSEILSSIARGVVKGNSNSSGMVLLTHVCRRWRESLISIPENWSLISNDLNEDLAAVCLQRAKAAPLETTIYIPFPFPQILESYVQNTRNLTVNYISTIEQFTGIFPNFPTSMPRLESLELNSQAIFDEDWSINPFEAFTFPLKSLSLSGIPLYPPLVKIRTLTELTLLYLEPLPLPLDAFLDFLEGNHSLKSADLDLTFAEPHPRNPQRRILNQLQYLSVKFMEPMHTRALITSMPLRRGAHLKIFLENGIAAMSEIGPDLLAAHLSNPLSPTFFQFKYKQYKMGILLRGPGGELSIKWRPNPEYPFPDFHWFPLANVREFRLCHFGTAEGTVLDPPVFHPPLFPSLEALTIQCSPEYKTNVRQVLATLLSNPTSSPLLKTLAFLNCALSEELMEELTEFASERKKTLTSTWLYRVLIFHRDGNSPSAASIRKLREYVRVVDVRMEDELPKDLT